MTCIGKQHSVPTSNILKHYCIIVNTLSTTTAMDNSVWWRVLGWVSVTGAVFLLGLAPLACVEQIQHQSHLLSRLSDGDKKHPWLAFLLKLAGRVREDEAGTSFMPILRAAGQLGEMM